MRIPKNRDSNTRIDRNEGTHPKELDSDPLVITPVGPRPRESVHPVRSDEAVRRDESGALSVVRKDQIASTGKEAPKMVDEYVRTPGGYRRRSVVHHVESGNRLDGRGGRYRKLDVTRNVLADYGLIVGRPHKMLPLMPRNVFIAAYRLSAVDG